MAGLKASIADRDRQIQQLTQRIEELIHMQPRDPHRKRPRTEDDDADLERLRQRVRELERNNNRGYEPLPRRKLVPMGEDVPF